MEGIHSKHIMYLNKNALIRPRKCAQWIDDANKKKTSSAWKTFHHLAQEQQRGFKGKEPTVQKSWLRTYHGLECSIGTTATSPPSPEDKRYNRTNIGHGWGREMTTLSTVWMRCLVPSSAFTVEMRTPRDIRDVKTSVGREDSPPVTSSQTWNSTPLWFIFSWICYALLVRLVLRWNDCLSKRKQLTGIEVCLLKEIVHAALFT